MKSLYCLTITSLALKLIQSFEGDVVGNEAVICHEVREEPSRDRNGNVIEGAFRIFFPNDEAICYTLSGEIAFLQK